MVSVTGYRKISVTGGSLCINVATLVKNTGMKAGDVVKVTIEKSTDDSLADE